MSEDFIRYHGFPRISGVGGFAACAALCKRDAAPKESLLDPSWLLFHRFIDASTHRFIDAGGWLTAGWLAGWLAAGCQVTGPPRQATGPPQSGAGVGVGMLRGKGTT